MFVLERVTAAASVIVRHADAYREAERRIDALYLIERQIKDLSDEERTRIRSAEAVPQLASLHECGRAKCSMRPCPRASSARLWVI